MKVSLKTMMPMIAASSIVAASCTYVSDNAKEYLKKNDRTQAEYNDLVKGLDLSNEKSNVVLQSRLDSLAYRDIFNSTQASKDSAKVADFNMIASKYRADFPKNEINMVDSAKNSIEKKLTDSKITIKDLDGIKSKVKQNLGRDVHSVVTMQHLADDWAYRKFFNKIGIYKDSIPQKCDEISKAIGEYN